MCLINSDTCSECEVDCKSDCNDLTRLGGKCFSELACQPALLFEEDCLPVEETFNQAVDEGKTAPLLKPNNPVEEPTIPSVKPTKPVCSTGKLKIRRMTPNYCHSPTSTKNEVGVTRQLVSNPPHPITNV